MREEVGRQRRVTLRHEFVRAEVCQWAEARGCMHPRHGRAGKRARVCMRGGTRSQTTACEPEDTDGKKMSVGGGVHTCTCDNVLKIARALREVFKPGRVCADVVGVHAYQA
eukprot:5118500-Pleurochrysis_carterae.AAC.1